MAKETLKDDAARALMERLKEVMWLGPAIKTTVEIEMPVFRARLSKDHAAGAAITFQILSDYFANKAESLGWEDSRGDLYKEVDNV